MPKKFVQESSTVIPTAGLMNFTVISRKVYAKLKKSLRHRYTISWRQCRKKEKRVHVRTLIERL
jgi:hypothetical protein